jgi:predicted DCC family thiol-disulfide oxidoreductase YuxK
MLIYDGDCGFCTTSVRTIERFVRPDVRTVAFQQVDDLAALGVTQRRAEYEVLLVDAGGRVHGGAQAFAHLLSGAGFRWALLGLPMRIPPFRWLAHGIYRLIADNRHRLPGGTPACAFPAGGTAGNQNAGK